MAWTNGRTRTSTPEWKRLYRKARRELPLVCAATGLTEAEAKAMGERLELDHITPHAEGGTDTIDNVQWLITSIHQQKSEEERQRGYRRRQSRRKLPAEPHPGLKIAPKSASLRQQGWGRPQMRRREAVRSRLHETVCTGLDISPGGAYDP